MRKEVGIKMRQKVAWGKLYLGLVFIILYAPILYLMIFSFSSGKTMEHYHGFSLQHYADLFADSRMITIVINTVLVAVLSSLIATIIGTLGALAIKETHGTWRRWQALSRVILPAISPGIMAGYFMALTYSLDDFAVTFFVTGNGFSTLSVEIYSRARQGVNLEINALSTLMFIVSLALVIGYYFVSKHAGRRQRVVTVKEGNAQ